MARTEPAGGKDEAKDGQAGSLVLIVPDTACGVADTKPAKIHTEAAGEVQPHSALAATAVFQELVAYLAEHHPGHMAQAAVFGQAAGLPWPELPTSGKGLFVNDVRTVPKHAQPGIASAHPPGIISSCCPEADHMALSRSPEACHPTMPTPARLARAPGAQVRWANMCKEPTHLPATGSPTVAPDTTAVASAAPTAAAQHQRKGCIASGTAAEAPALRPRKPLSIALGTAAGSAAEEPADAATSSAPPTAALQQLKRQQPQRRQQWPRTSRPAHSLQP